MKIVLKIASIGLVGLSLLGCTITRDLSKKPFFANQIGERLTIKRECLLASGQDSWDKVESGEESWFRGAPYQLYDKEKGSNAWRKSGWISPGTELIIQSVLYRNTIQGPYIDTYGILFVDGKEISFWYSWHYFSQDLAIKRAPWEDSNVPEKRTMKKL